MQFTDLEQEYLTHLATQRACSPNTLRTYRSAFARCREVSALIGTPDPDTERIDRRWANLLVQELCKSLRPRTVHRNITAWRTMLAYAIEEGYTEQNPLAGVRMPRKDAVRREPVSTEDLRRLLAATEKLYNPVRAAMAHALLLTSGTAATRYSDLIPLRISDLDLDAGTLLIRKGKGNKSRVIPLPQETVAVLATWLTVREKWLATWPEERGRHSEPDDLWLADRGRRLGEDGLRKLLRELCLIAGIDRKITLHDIRHSAATRMARRGMPLVGIQAVLGHTNLTTTQTYIGGSGPQLLEWAEKMSLEPETDAVNRPVASSPISKSRQKSCPVSTRRRKPCGRRARSSGRP